MSKTMKNYLLILAAAVVAIALFALGLCLALPLGGRASVLPLFTMYIFGGVAAAFFLAMSVVFFIGSRSRS